MVDRDQLSCREDERRLTCVISYRSRLFRRGHVSGVIGSEIKMVANRGLSPQL